MTKPTKALCPRTLRWVALQCRKEQRGCNKSEALLRRTKSNGDTASFFRGFGASAMHRADWLLNQAKSLESRATKRKAKR